MRRKEHAYLRAFHHSAANTHAHTTATPSSTDNATMTPSSLDNPASCVVVVVALAAPCVSRSPHAAAITAGKSLFSGTNVRYVAFIPQPTKAVSVTLAYPVDTSPAGAIAPAVAASAAACALTVALVMQRASAGCARSVIAR